MPLDQRQERALKSIAESQEKLVKAIEIFNKNVVLIGRAVVPAAQQMQQLFELMTEGSGEVSTGIFQDAEPVTSEVMTDEQQEPVAKPRYVMIPITESSAMTLRECGYEPFYESGSFGIALPILKEDPSSGTTE